MARASVLDASWTPSCGGVLGASHWEETQGKTQDTLEGLCLPTGLGTPYGAFPLHGTVRFGTARYGTVQLSSGRFAFPLQFSTAIEWAAPLLP